MQTKGFSMKRTVLGAVAAAALMLGGAAQAALQDRDLDKDGVTDAFYDTDLNITWLRNANVNGPMNWATAVTWADTFSLGGYDDWRLPAMSGDRCFGYGCVASEMGHLWYVELGNSAGSMSSTGNFLNLQSYDYWSSEDALDVGSAWTFFTTVGYQRYDYVSHELYAMAVRDGDVKAVPEPETYALMLAGLAALALARRQKQR